MAQPVSERAFRVSRENAKNRFITHTRLSSIEYSKAIKIESHPCMTMRTRRRAGDGEIARLPWGSDVLRAAAGVQLGFLNLTRFLPSNGALSNRNRQDYGKGKAL